MSWDAVFRCESESTLSPKEDTTRNQWLSCINNTVPEQFNQIFECVQHILRRTVSWIWKSNVSLQCRLLKDCFYKAGALPALQGQSVLLTQSKYVFIFKERVTDDSHMSFELCRVALVISPITNADVVMFTRCNATRHVKNSIISHYNTALLTWTSNWLHVIWIM